MDVENQVADPIKDEQDAFSVINMVPSYVAAGIRAIPDELFDLSIEDIEKKGEVDSSIKKLRIAFWIEYERAARTQTQIQMNNVTSGIVHNKFFAKKVATNSYKLAFILTPPENYKITMEEMLHMALSEERKILLTPLEIKIVKFDNEGSPTSEMTMIDSKLAAVKHKIRESLQNRLHGMPLHRSIQVTENTNRNVGENAPSIRGALSPTDMNKLSNNELRNYRDQMRTQDSPMLLDVSGDKADE